MNHLRLMDKTNANEMNPLAWLALRGTVQLAHRATLSQADGAIAKDKNLLHLRACRLAHNNPQARSSPEIALKDLQVGYPTVAFRQLLTKPQALPPTPKPYARWLHHALLFAYALK